MVFEAVYRAKISSVLVVVELDTLRVALDVQEHVILVITKPSDQEKSKIVVLSGILSPTSSALR